MELLLSILVLALIYGRARNAGVSPWVVVIPALLGWYGIAVGFSFLATIPAFFYLGIALRWGWLAFMLWMAGQPRPRPEVPR